jgi:AraC-like DNA-binding protein
MVLARLHLGTHEGVLGVSAAAIRGAARPIPLEDLWGGAAAERLVDRLGDARDTPRAAVILERAIAERLAAAPAPRASARLALAAAGRLTSGSVRDVAFELGLSERHLRRVFGETVGVSPKTFARLARFRRALRAARTGAHPGWATIATAAGYYDQAHLISEFRAIAGTTPQGLLGELRAAASGGWRGAEA